MKKISNITTGVWILVFSVFLVKNASGQPGSKLPIRAVSLDWNDATLKWDTARSYIYEYDNFGRLITSTQELVKNNLERRTRSQKVYNGAGFLIESTYEIEVDGSWSIASHNRKHYDKNNNLILDVWLNGNGDTTEAYRYILEVNDLKQVLLRDQYTFLSDTGIWETSYREELTYDSSGTLASTTNYRWKDNAWTVQSRAVDITVYDSIKNEESYTYQYFRNGEWVNGHRFAAIYLAPGKKLSLVQQWWNDSTGLWKNTERETRLYDTNQNIIQRKLENYDPISDTWKFFSENRHTNEYYSDNSLKKVLTEYYDPNNGWRKSTAENYVLFYSQPTGNLEEGTLRDFVKIFPNPAQETIEISDVEGEISLFNQLGDKFWSGKTFNSNVQVDVSKFPSGQYILKIENLRGVLSQKIIIAR